MVQPRTIERLRRVAARANEKLALVSVDRSEACWNAQGYGSDRSTRGDERDHHIALVEIQDADRTDARAASDAARRRFDDNQLAAANRFSQRRIGSHGNRCASPLAGRVPHRIRQLALAPVIGDQQHRARRRRRRHEAGREGTCW